MPERLLVKTDLHRSENRAYRTTSHQAALHRSTIRPGDRQHGTLVLVRHERRHRHSQTPPRPATRPLAARSKTSKGTKAATLLQGHPTSPPGHGRDTRQPRRRMCHRMQGTPRRQQETRMRGAIRRSHPARSGREGAAQARQPHHQRRTGPAAARRIRCAEDIVRS